MRVHRPAALLLAAAATICFASPAQAKEIDTIIWERPASPFNTHGRVYFATDGDHIGIYDDYADGESVCIDFYATPVSTGKRKLYSRCNSGGKGSRKDFDFDFVENTEVNIRGWMYDQSAGYDHAYGEWYSTIA
ncbi:hypothetical protein ABZ172_12145 [Streptomyces sp. NPDC006296]|uniref:hypothetical protein n=1 Tax=Streptomyces sp. NPDC006296 TaxID=3156746 RepID=UPI0033B9D6DE